jgi:hypothetical protein
LLLWKANDWDGFFTVPVATMKAPFQIKRIGSYSIMCKQLRLAFNDTYKYVILVWAPGSPSKTTFYDAACKLSEAFPRIQLKIKYGMVECFLSPVLTEFVCGFPHFLKVDGKKIVR